MTGECPLRCTRNRISQEHCPVITHTGKRLPVRAEHDTIDSPLYDRRVSPSVPTLSYPTTTTSPSCPSGKGAPIWAKRYAYERHPIPGECRLLFPRHRIPQPHLAPLIPAIIMPSGLKTMLLIELVVYPVSVRFCSPVSVFHNRTAPSQSPAASVFPSGLKTTPEIPSVSVALCSHVSTSTTEPYCQNSHWQASSHLG